MEIFEGEKCQMVNKMCKVSKEQQKGNVRE